VSRQKDVQTDEKEGDEDFKKRRVFVLVLQKKIMNSKSLHSAEGIDGSHWRDIIREEG